jgi:hypothetical protein
MRVSGDNIKMDINANGFLFKRISSQPHWQNGNFWKVNIFTATVDFSRSNFSIANAPLFQLISAAWPLIIGGKLTQQLQYIQLT